MKIDIDVHILSEIIRNHKEVHKQIDIADKAMVKLREMIARNEALYMHLDGEIEEINTGKGMETKNKQKHKKKGGDIK